MLQKTMDEEKEIRELLLPPKLPAWWRALPALIIIVIISTIDSLILNDFVVTRYTNAYQLNSTSSGQSARELCLNRSQTAHPSDIVPSHSTTPSYPQSTTMSPNDAIQASTARLNVYISLAATLPSIITSIILGANCDRIGRKPLITLPFVGKILRYVTLTAVAYYDLSDLWIILSVMFDGLFGTASLTLLSAFAYASDCTTEKTRTVATIVTEVSVSCSRFLPLLTMGIYLQQPRFIQSMIITLALSLLGFLFCLICQPESNVNVRHLNIFQQLKLVRFKPVKNVFQVYFVKREAHRQRSLLMLITIHLSVIVMICGQIAIIYLYLYGAPFCMDSLGVSLNSTAQTVFIILCTIPFTLTVAKHPDHLIYPALGCIAFMTQLVLFGITSEIWVLYVAVCIGGLIYVLIPIIRSRITKLVEPDEYAVVFILASVFESGGYFAISAVANEIYGATLTFCTGCVFYVFALVGLLAVVLIAYVGGATFLR